MLLLSAVQYHWQVETQPVVGADPDPAWLLREVADCFWADPALCWALVDDEAAWAASTTSILPPNWKELVLT